MKHALTAMWLLAALAAAQAGPAAAETPAMPEAAPTGEPKADPTVERQRHSAAKLAGMVRFVAIECQDTQPDYDRFKKVIAAMGVDIKDLEQGTLMIESLRYSEAYKKEPAESCKRAFEHFGDSGTTIPGLLARKAPDSKDTAPKDTAPENPASKEPAPKQP